MCGIAGIYSSGAADIQNQLEVTVKMTDALAHRGPDDNGVEIINPGNPGITFGHRRLSIIDLSPAGHQPMQDEATGNWITYNGEIYNFQKLRDTLTREGFSFKSKSDTEVILKAYRFWGADCVKHLRGIFAFAIWDEKRNRLMLARDHMGVKPLYYTENCGGAYRLSFASEVRALLAGGKIPRKADYRALRSYLAYGSVQDPYTLIEGIRSLLPGHLMLIENGSSSTHRYWHLPDRKGNSIMDQNEIQEQIAEKLRETVKSQLISDVPIGAFLSGGIDSTAVAALMKQSALGEVKTFSIVFDEKSHDEREYSRLAAGYIGSDHTELNLRGDYVRDMLHDGLNAFDQPSMDGLNTYFVSKITREAGLTVALSGVGGDELFGGYNGYAVPLMAEKWGRYLSAMPLLLRTPLGKLLAGMPVSERFRKFAELLIASRHPYFIARQVFSENQSRRLLVSDIASESEDWEPGTFAELETITRTYDSINRASAMELQTYMLSTLLRDTDQMSMAHALEVRVPLIDHELVEFMFKLPGEVKVSKEVPKPMLTRSLNGSLPHDCVYRPKQGFELPFSTWFKDSLGEELRQVFTDSKPDDAWPFRTDSLQKTWADYQKGALNWGRIWTLFMLIRWMKAHKITI